MTLTPGANVIKHFLSVIYGFSYKARVFVSLDWKSLPMTNTLVYYETPKFTDKKSFIRLTPGGQPPLDRRSVERVVHQRSEIINNYSFGCSKN